MSKVTKLGIGMATQGLVETRTAFSLITAIQFVEVPMQLFLGMGCYIHHNKEMVVNQALENGCSHVLFVGSDMIFNHDVINKLILCDKEIVGTKYNKITSPPTSIIKENLTGLGEVSFVGDGLLLVDLEVFRKIGKPYFYFDAEAEDEDLYFCHKALKNGFKLWCDPTIQVGHIGTVIY